MNILQRLQKTFDLEAKAWAQVKSDLEAIDPGSTALAGPIVLLIGLALLLPIIAAILP